MSTNIQPGSALALADYVNQPECCRQCEGTITGEPFIRECEVNAPYQPAGYCSVECRDLADEAAYEQASERA